MKNDWVFEALFCKPCAAKKFLLLPVGGARAPAQINTHAMELEIPHVIHSPSISKVVSNLDEALAIVMMGVV